MPEGDTVWLVARRLDDALAGDVLRRTDLRVPALATTDLSGRRVLEVRPRGKHLLTRLEGGLTLHTHLRMDGMWHLYRRGCAGRAVRPPGPGRARDRRLGRGRLPPARGRAARDRRTRTTPSGTWAPTCSTRASTAPRRCAGCGAEPGARRSGRRCSTSGCSPASATSTRPRCSSSGAPRPGRRWARSTTSRASWSWPGVCSRPTSARRAGHDRRPAPRTRALGLRPYGPPLPALRDADPQPRCRARRPATGSRRTAPPASPARTAAESG